MSYLDVPRINFGGIFYTDPNTINNVIQLYHPDWSNPPLMQPDGTYTEDLTIDGQPSGRDWNPTGVAQFWFEDCQVVSVVGPDGRTVRPGDPDPLTKAKIETPSPKTPQTDPTGYRDLAKMVDIDPDQQGRSELFGLSIYVKLPDGGGFHALFDRPHLRFAFARPNPNAPSGPPFLRGSGGFDDGYIQPVGGIWTAKLTRVSWDGGSSPLLEALKRRATNNTLQMRLAVDVYERDQRLRYGDAGKGNRFGYGRVMGTIGPCDDGEPSQIVPGRLLDAWRPATSTKLTADSAQFARNFKNEDFSQTEAAVRATDGSDPQPSDWNVAPVVIRDRGGKSFLTIDLGMAIPLINAPAPVGAGKMIVDGPITVGYYEGNNFIALGNGTIELNDASYVQIESALDRKNAYWLTNSGVFEFELKGGETGKISKLPLGVSVNGTPKLIESTDGLFYDVEPTLLRMEPNKTNQDANLRIYRFGNPVKQLSEVPDFYVTSAVNHWFQLLPQPLGQVPLGKDADWNSQSEITEDIAVKVLPATPTGLFPLSVTTGPAVSLPVMRQPLDSQIYFVMINPDRGGESGAPPLSVLFWQNHWVSDNPTWESTNGKMGVGEILKAYARLYPGMREKMDIGNEEMVKGAVDSIMSFMSSDFGSPDYMPVVRDLSPSVVEMILKWLNDV